MKPVALVLVFLFAAVALPQERAAEFELTIDKIMRGPELVGRAPREVRWSGDGRFVYFRWQPAGEKEEALYVAAREGGGPRKLSEDEEKKAPPFAGEFDRQKKRMVFAEEGDLFIYDLLKGERRQITATKDVESDPHFCRQEKSVCFTRAGNLYALELESGAIEQLTDIRSGSERKDEPTLSQKFLREEEKRLLKTVRERAEKREKEERERKEREKIKPFYLGEKRSASSLRLSPNGRWISFMVAQEPTGSRHTFVPEFVTESGYVESIESRTKVGDATGKRRLAFMNTENGEVVWADHGQGERQAQFLEPKWSEDGDKCMGLVRSLDNKDRWILLYDPATGKSKVLDHLHDDAWIGGTGWATAGWMPDNKSVYFLSERDGYMHLYTVSIDGGEPKQLTSGRFEVYSPRISRDRKSWYFVSNEAHPGERHFYTMPLEGGERVRLTGMPGNHQPVLSPDEDALAIVYSYSNKPPELYLQENRPGAIPRQVTLSTSEEFRAYSWLEPQIVTFAARDGATVYARLYTPEMLAAERRPRLRRGEKRPGVIFVHGAGYLQNAHKWWSSYYREYMFHHYLIERGYVVIDVDYRASAGYGRAWRTAIYRHMGGKDLDDQLDAAKYLVERHNVDPKRIGIYGGSYGGFIALMAMFARPEVFAAGAALRPVTDWAHYNDTYTSNILNRPQDDPEAYRRSSPIYFAEGLKGALLICHGMKDTNVHFQDTVRLVQRLIELGKENWEVAIYPVEDHDFQEASSWADEYRRIFKLFERTLKPAGADKR